MIPPVWVYITEAKYCYAINTEEFTMPGFDVIYDDDERESISEDVQEQLSYENALQPDRAAEIVRDMAALHREHANDVDPIYKEAMEDSMNKMFKSRIAGSSLINEQSWQDLNTFNNAVTEYVTDTKVKVGNKLEEYKGQIRNGEIDGTEDFYDNDDPNMEAKVNQLAINLMFQQDHELMLEFMGADALEDMFEKAKKAHKFTKTVDTGNKTVTGQPIMENITKSCDEWLFDETRKKQDELFASKYKDLADKKESIIGIEHKDMKSQDAFGFVMNKDYKEGDKPFSSVPENRIEKHKRLAREQAQLQREEDEKQLGDYHSKLNRSMNDLEEYQRQALGLATEAKKMLKELKSYKKEKGAENSDSYEELRKSLLSLSRLGTGRNMPPEELAMSVDPKKVERSLARVASASADYIKEHRGPFSGNGKVGINRQDLAVRAQTFAKLGRKKMDLDNYNITKEKLTVQAQRINNRLDQVEALNQERGYKRLPERGMNTDEVSRMLNSSINEANQADKEVRLGSSEYSDAVKAAKKVDAELKKFAEMAADPKNTGAVLETQRKKLDKTIRTAESAAKKYLDKKQKESTPLAGMNHDERVQRRIDAIEDCQHAVKLARGNMNALVHHLQSTRMSKSDIKKKKQLDEDERLWQRLSKGSSFDPTAQQRQSEPIRNEQNNVQNDINAAQSSSQTDNQTDSQNSGSGDTANIDAHRSVDQPPVNNQPNIANQIIRNEQNALNDQAEAQEEEPEPEEQIRKRNEYESHVSGMVTAAADTSLRQQTARLAENDLRALQNMTNRREFVQFDKEQVLKSMAGVVYNELVHSNSFRHDSQSANTARSQQELNNSIDTIAASEDFQNIVGDVNKDSVRKFLADPSRVKNEFIKAYREKEAQRDAQQRLEANSTGIRRTYTNDMLDERVLNNNRDPRQNENSSGNRRTNTNDMIEQNTDAILQGNRRAAQNSSGIRRKNTMDIIEQNTNAINNHNRKQNKGPMRK